jgi:uncharacterized protein
VPELSIALLLLITGFIAGACNAVAGGGTFFTFPAFLAAGLPPVVANASNSVAVWPGHAFAAIWYRAELSRRMQNVRGSLLIALLGGIVGAVLASVIANQVFAGLIPFLLLFATLLFAFGRRVSVLIERPTTERPHASLGSRCVEFVVAIYGGFFGAGLGIMLMASLLMLGVHDLQASNALKNLLGAVINSVAVLVFAVLGVVSWPHTLIAFVGAITGGLAGARLARRLSETWLRRIVIAVGLFLSAYYFWRYYNLSAAWSSCCS